MRHHNPDFKKAIQKELENKKKGIPSQVFFNHFEGIYYHITKDKCKYTLKDIEYFSELKVRNSEFSLDKCKNLLFNAWSTEHAFNLAGEIDNPDYYKYAFHWNFPQAYYSVYLAMTAFHETQGIANNQHEKSIKTFGNHIKDNHYPVCISFYAEGMHQEFSYCGLGLFQGFPHNFNPISEVRTEQDAQMQIASILKTTRERNVKVLRKRAIENKDKRFLTKQGELRKTFRKEHWDLLYAKIPVTSIMNIIYRMRIKANYNDINTFLDAKIDFKDFHARLSFIISYLNFFHEAYIWKSIGNKKYKTIIDSFKINGELCKTRERYELIKENN